MSGEELTTQGEGDGLAFEVREPNPGERLEIRFSDGDRRLAEKKKHHRKRHEKDLDRLNTFFKLNLPKNYWEKGKPTHVTV